MAQKIKSVKQKLQSGIYSNPIPFGANGINIDMANGYNLEATLGEIDVANKGNVQVQLNKHTQDIASNKASIESNDADIVGLQSRCFTIETGVSANDTAIKTNANAIANNAANIASNDADILSLQNKVSKNEADISKNTTAISNITTDITEMNNKITTNTQTITSQETSIVELDTKITTEVKKLNDSIEAIGKANSGSNADIILRLGQAETDIINHTTTINQHTADIEDLKPKVEKNIEDIQDRVTKEEAGSFVKQIDYTASTYTFVFTKYDGSTQTIELPLENIIKEGHFDEEKEEIVLVLSTGAEVRIPAASLVDDYTGKENTQIKVSVSNNTIEATLKEKSLDESYLSTDLQDKINRIEDTYSKMEVDTLFSSITKFEEVSSW